MDYAQLLYAQERWYGLVDVLRAALAITERPRTYICEADAWGSLPYDLLSLAYAHLGDAENAADACRNAVERSPQEERLRKNLALFEQRQRAVTLAHFFVLSIPSFWSAADPLFGYCLAE